jgi:hypothetical protein
VRYPKTFVFVSSFWLLFSPFCFSLAKERFVFALFSVSHDNFIDKEEFELFFQKGHVSVLESFGEEN